MILDEIGGLPLAKDLKLCSRFCFDCASGWKISQGLKVQLWELPEFSFDKQITLLFICIML
jgi:hypothetical protein